MTYYANDQERSRLTTGLRDLADFLESRPDVPAPRLADVSVFPPNGTDDQRRAEIDAIASCLAEQTHETAGGHYKASRCFGPVEYHAVAIPRDNDRKESKSMPVPILILIGVGLLGFIALGTLAVLIIGIRRGYCRHLTRAPETSCDALARRALTGVRYPSEMTGAKR
jgi:hypothetical protein